MRNMRKLAFIIIYLTIASVLAIHLLPDQQKVVDKLLHKSPCDTPISYSIGSIDPRFNISDQALKKDIQDATDIWNSAQGKTLFVYNPDAKLTVNMVYDERQGLNSQINGLENQVENNKTNLQSQIDEYNRLSQDYKTRVDNLNSQIDYWNSRGGAPKEQYDQLTAQQQSLEKEASSLNALAQKLNLQTNNYNQQVVNLNQKINTFNADLEKKPEEGLYIPDENRIEIYFDTSQNELEHTLAHELGHALGLDHNQNPMSVMYPYTTESLKLSAEDMTALKVICAGTSN